MQSDGRNHGVLRILSCLPFLSNGKFVEQLVELAVSGSASYPSPERAVTAVIVLVRQKANRCQPSSMLFPSLALSHSRVLSMQSVKKGTVEK